MCLVSRSNVSLISRLKPHKYLSAICPDKIHSNQRVPLNRFWETWKNEAAGAVCGLSFPRLVWASLSWIFIDCAQPGRCWAGCCSWQLPRTVSAVLLACREGYYGARALLACTWPFLCWLLLVSPFPKGSQKTWKDITLKAESVSTISFPRLCVSLSNSFL